MCLYPKSTSFSTRSTLTEKVLTVELKKEFVRDEFYGNFTSMCAWYFEAKYQNLIFLVRHSTKEEFEDMMNSKIFGKCFKERCSIEGFYIIVGTNCSNMFLGRIDCEILK
jgi:hypothetical protein